MKKEDKRLKVYCEDKKVTKMSVKTLRINKNRRKNE